MPSQGGTIIPQHIYFEVEGVYRKTVRRRGYNRTQNPHRLFYFLLGHLFHDFPPTGYSSLFLVDCFGIVTRGKHDRGEKPIHQQYVPQCGECSAEKVEYVFIFRSQHHNGSPKTGTSGLEAKESRHRLRGYSFFRRPAFSVNRKQARVEPQSNLQPTSVLCVWLMK